MQNPLLDPNFIGNPNSFRQPVAAPPVMQTPNAMQAQGGGLAQSLKGMLPDILIGLGTGLASGNMAAGTQYLAQAADQRQAQQRQRQASSATVKWLQSKNRPDLAELLDAGAIDAGEALRLATSKEEVPADYRLYQLGQQDPGFADFLAKRGQNEETFGLNPIYGRGPDGKPVLLQPSNRGNFNQLEIPEGVEVLGPYEKAVENNRGKTVGTTQGEAISSLPGAVSSGEALVQKVDELVTHPMFNDMIGPVQGRIPAMSGGAQDWEARLEQITGGAFLQARQELKGGGPITDFEGKKAEQALVRMRRSTSEEDFMRAAEDFKAAIRRGYTILQQQAGQGAQAAPAQEKVLRYNPQTGKIE